MKRIAQGSLERIDSVDFMGMASSFRWSEVRDFFPDERVEVRPEYQQDETITGINGTCAPQHDVDVHSWWLFERWIEEAVQRLEAHKALVTGVKQLGVA